MRFVLFFALPHEEVIDSWVMTFVNITLEELIGLDTEPASEKHMNHAFEEAYKKLAGF